MRWDRLQENVSLPIDIIYKWFSHIFPTEPSKGPCANGASPSNVMSEYMAEAVRVGVNPNKFWMEVGYDPSSTWAGCYFFAEDRVLKHMDDYLVWLTQSRGVQSYWLVWHREEVGMYGRAVSFSCDLPTAKWHARRITTSPWGSGPGYWK